MRNPLQWRIIGAAFISGSIVLFGPFIYLSIQGGQGLFQLPEIWDKIYQTIPLLVGTLFLSTFFALVACIKVLKSRNSSLWMLLFLLPLSFPTYIMAFNWATIWDFLAPVFSSSRSAIKSLSGLIIVCALCLYPYVLLPLYLFCKKEISQILAQSIAHHIPLAKTLKKVILPLSFTPITLGSALVGYELLNDYGAAKYYGVSTITTQIFRSWFGKNMLLEALGLAMLLLLLVVFVKFLNERLRKTQSESKANIYPISWNTLIPKPIHLGVNVFSFLIIFLALALPIMAMAYGLWFDWELQDWSKLWAAALNSIYLSGLGALFTALLVFGIGFSSNFLKWRIAASIEKVLATGYAIPGAVIAVAVMGLGLALFKSIATINTETALLLNNSILLLLVGLVIKMFAVAYPYSSMFWSYLGKNQYKAIKSFYPYKTTGALKSIVLPQSVNYFLAALLFVFIDCLKELPLTLILRPFNFQTLAAKAFNLVEDEFLYRAAPYSLIISLFCAVGIICYQRLQRLDQSKQD